MRSVSTYQSPGAFRRASLDHAGSHPAARPPVSALAAPKPQSEVRRKPALLYHNITGKDVESRGRGLCLSCGTSLERIAAESLTRRLSEFVHGHMSRHGSKLPQHRVMARR